MYETNFANWFWLNLSDCSIRSLQASAVQDRLAYKNALSAMSDVGQISNCQSWFNPLKMLNRANSKLENIFFNFIDLISSLKYLRSLISHLFNTPEAIYMWWGDSTSKITCKGCNKTLGEFCRCCITSLLQYRTNSNTVLAKFKLILN